MRLNVQPNHKLVERSGKPLSETESKQVQDNMRQNARSLLRRTYRMNLGKLSGIENTHELTLEGNSSRPPQNPVAPSNTSSLSTPKPTVSSQDNRKSLAQAVSLSPAPQAKLISHQKASSQKCRSTSRLNSEAANRPIASPTTAHSTPNLPSTLSTPNKEGRYPRLWLRHLHGRNDLKPVSGSSLIANGNLTP